jgi:hypothetical protein
MKPFSKMTLRELFKRQEVLDREMDSGPCSETWREWKLLQEVIDKRDEPAPTPIPTTHDTYAQIRWPKVAIPLCLKRNHRWMTREEIKSDLETGGFVIDNAFTFSALLSDALRYHSGRGSLIRRDQDGNLIKQGAYKSHTRFPNEQYGLPEWLDEPPVENPK